MMKLRIAESRKLKGWSQLQLANALNTTQTQISRWEQGDRDPTVTKMEEMADALGVSMPFLLGLTPDPRILPYVVEAKAKYRPVLGRISAGVPREAIEHSSERHPISYELEKEHPNGFWLQVSGNSMNRLFPDRSLVYVDMNAPYHDGDVVVVFVNGDDATVKRIYWEGDAIRLSPDSYDPEYRDRVILASDPDSPEVRVLGKVVSYTAPSGWRA